LARYIAAYLAAAVVMAALDYLWLGYFSKAFFEPAVGSLLAARTDMSVAVLFYVLYIVGILLFAVSPALRGGGWSTALALGAAFGFFAYMTYDLTNMATLKVWPVHIAAIDIAWGTLVTGVAALAGYAAASRLG
jgi:uncharacterized membrane protein